MLAILFAMGKVLPMDRKQPTRTEADFKDDLFIALMAACVQRMGMQPAHGCVGLALELTKHCVESRRKELAKP